MKVLKALCATVVFIGGSAAATAQIPDDFPLIFELINMSSKTVTGIRVNGTTIATFAAMPPQTRQTIGVQMPDKKCEATMTAAYEGRWVTAVPFDACNRAPSQVYLTDKLAE